MSNLSAEKIISIPGTYNEGSGIADYMSEQNIKVDVIEVIQNRGVYYDNTEGYTQDKYIGYSYYYFYENNDGIFNIIFTVDPAYGEVKAIGFDYDLNGIFEPNKYQVVEKHIISSEP